MVKFRGKNNEREDGRRKELAGESGQTERGQERKKGNGERRKLWWLMRVKKYQ